MLGQGALGEFAIGETGDAFVGYSLAASPGSFTLTGNSVGLTAARVLYAGQFVNSTRRKQFGFAALGEVALGESIQETATDQVTFRLSEPDSGLKVGYNLQASAGSFTLTGVDLTLAYSRVLTAGVGAFTLTGIDQTLEVARNMSVAAGSYTLSGIAAELAIGRRKLYAFPRSGSVTRGIVRAGSVTRGITRSGYDPVKVRAYGG